MAPEACFCVFRVDLFAQDQKGKKQDLYQKLIIRMMSKEINMKFQIPQPMIEEHEELHTDLKKAIMAGGKVGEAAEVVANVLHPHFDREEKFALPPLGLLSALSKGKIEPEMVEVLKMTDKLKAELPTMLEEHKTIVAALEKLKEAAKQEKKPEVVHFAEKLVLHAETEEQVSYPTAILIGEYLKLKLSK